MNASSLKTRKYSVSLPAKILSSESDFLYFRRRHTVIKVERKVGYGSDQSILARLTKSPSHTINNVYIERSNLDWRLWDAHLTRKAPTVARSMRWLKVKFAICVASYNLIRPYERLAVARIASSGPKLPQWRQI